MPLEVMRRLAGDGASDTLRWRVLHGGTGRSLDDGLRALGVRVTALVQRAACECSDACQCCQLPANALCATSIYAGIQLLRNIHRLRSSLCILYSLFLHHHVHQPCLLFYFYTCIYTILSIYIGTIYIDIYVFFSASLLRFYIYMYI